MEGQTTRERYVKGYKWLRDTLKKHLILDEYIENSATRYGVNSWDKDIIEDMFLNLSTLNPYNANISAEVIREDYFARYKSKYVKKNELSMVDSLKSAYRNSEDKDNVKVCFAIYKLSKTYKGDELKEVMDYDTLTINGKILVDQYIKGTRD